MSAAVRSARIDVRNPILAIEEVRREFDALPPEAKAALVKMLRAASRVARAKAADCKASYKAPMYAYWQTWAVNAGHAARAGDAS